MGFDPVSYLMGKSSGGGGGGGGGSSGKKQVNFIDYDGTILHSYTAEEANSLTALPENPSHTGLVAQGWNWTLVQIKARLMADPDGPIWVGQMYITQSGDTEIYVSIPEGRLSPILTIVVNGTITVDWGDNTTADTVTGSSITTSQSVPHIYATPGDYIIKIKAVSGEYSFYGPEYTILRKNTDTGEESLIYANCVQSIRLGSSVTSIEEGAFSYCYSLASVTIPNGVTSIGGYAFSDCYSLASVTIPNGVTSIEEDAFSNCYSLASVTIPNGITSIEEDAFSDCYSLASVTIPNGITSIGGYAFSNCYSLASVTIPNGVTSIEEGAFYNCYGVANYHIKPTSVPTGGVNMFSDVSDCVIYVPSESLEAYKTDTYWSSYASYMQGE